VILYAFSPRYKTLTKTQGSFPFRYIIQTKNLESDLNTFREKGIKVEKPIFRPLHHYLSLDPNLFPNTEKAYKITLSIPLYPALKDNEIETIINAIPK